MVVFVLEGERGGREEEAMVLSQAGYSGGGVSGRLVGG